VFVKILSYLLRTKSCPFPAVLTHWLKHKQVKQLKRAHKKSLQFTAHTGICYVDWWIYLGIVVVLTSLSSSTLVNWEIAICYRRFYFIIIKDA
jgi:hypothetical protein